MRYQRAAAGLLFFLLFAVDAWSAQISPQEWSWRAGVAAGPESGIVALPLDAAIYDKLHNAPNDLRLVEQSGTLVPHTIQCGRAVVATATIARPIQIVDRTYAPKRYSRAVLDFGGSTVKNKVTVDLSGSNFRRRVAVEGSDDRGKWEMVAENNFLFDIHVPGQAHRVDTLIFPDNNFRYLRLTVENMPDDPDRVEITGAKAFYQEPIGPAQLSPVEIVDRRVEQDNKTNSTVIAVDLGYRNLPLEQIALMIETPQFERSYVVEGRNSLKHKIYRRTEEAWRAEERETPWSSIRQGTFYRRRDDGKVSEATAASIPYANYRYLRMTIKNRDDNPLDIRDVTVQRRTCALLFEARPEARYMLYGGSDKADAPFYDFARLTPGMDIIALPQVSHGNIETLKAEEPDLPWSERYWYVITGAVIISVLLMLAIILPVLKKQLGEEQQK
ncbi:MAG TPA: DUF3999 family protein [Candidatus Binatia bacterium]